MWMRRRGIDSSGSENQNLWLVTSSSSCDLFLIYHILYMSFQFCLVPGKGCWEQGTKIETTVWLVGRWKIRHLSHRPGNVHLQYKVRLESATWHSPHQSVQQSQWKMTIQRPSHVSLVFSNLDRSKSSTLNIRSLSKDAVRSRIKCNESRYRRLATIMDK